MPRYNVEYDGKWACFSSIVDGFVTEFMNKAEYEEWRKKEYGVNGYEPAEKCNRMSMEEAIERIKMSAEFEEKEAVQCLVESGLPQDICEELINI